MVLLVGTMIVLAMWLIITVASQHPGTIGRLTSVRSLFPLVYGYMNMFKISYSGALVFCVIPCFGVCWAMIYIITKQFQSMASSALLPECLLYTVTKDKIPVLCYFVVCVCAYLATCYFSAINRFVAGSQIATLAGVLVYISMFWCYFVFKFRHSHMERTFQNPLSYFSVLTGVAVFILGFFYVFVVGVFVFFLFYLTIVILYYFCWVRSRQKFSNTEQEVFFKAYVLKSKTSFTSLLWFVLQICPLSFIVNSRKRRKTWSSWLYGLCCERCDKSKHGSRVHLGTHSHSTGHHTVTETHPSIFPSRSNDDDNTTAIRSSNRDGSSTSIGMNRIYNRITDSSDLEDHPEIERIQEVLNDDEDDDESVVAKTAIVTTALQPSSPHGKSISKIAAPVATKETSSVELFTVTNDNEALHE
jgi:hypothetical protein